MTIGVNTMMDLPPLTSQEEDAWQEFIARQQEMDMYDKFISSIDKFIDDNMQMLDKILYIADEHNQSIEEAFDCFTHSLYAKFNEARP